MTEGPLTSPEAVAEALRRVGGQLGQGDQKDEIRARLLESARSLNRSSGVARGPSLRRLLAAGSLAVAAATTWALWPSSAREAAPPVAHREPLRRGAVEAEPGAHFELLSAQPNEVVRLGEGTVTLRVTPLHAGERFRVLVGESEVEVHGTVFTVVAHAQRLERVSVEQGRVEVRPAAAAPQLLTAGQEWRLPRSVGPSSPVPLQPADDAAKPRKQKALALTEPAAPASAGASAGEVAFQDGWAALRQGDFLTASRAFGRVPRDSVMGPDALFWSGIALARARHFGEAAPILEQFLAAFPGSPHGAEARMTLGDAQLALGQKDAARASYERAAQSSRADVRARAEAALGALR